MSTVRKSRIAERARAGIGRYEAADRGPLFAFRQEVYPGDPIQLDEPRFDWLYEGHPLATGNGPDLWLCKRDGVIVGQQGGIPVALKTGARLVNASWAIDLIVDPAWRLRGVAPALSEAYGASRDMVLGLGISDSAYRAFKRAGWLDLGVLDFFVRVLDPVASLQIVGKTFRPLRAVSMISRLSLRALDGVATQLAGLGGIKARKVTHFDESIDEVWSTASPGYTAIVTRDYKALSWRFDKIPNADRYYRVVLEQRGRASGYFVFCMTKKEGHTVAVLVDFLAAPGHLNNLFRHVIAHAHGLGAAAIFCWMLSHRASRALRWQGFIPMPGDRPGTRRFRFMAKVPEGSDLTELVGDPGNWHVTFADSDVEIC